MCPLASVPQLRALLAPERTVTALTLLQPDLSRSSSAVILCGALATAFPLIPRFQHRPGLSEARFRGYLFLLPFQVRPLPSAWPVSTSYQMFSICNGSLLP